MSGIFTAVLLALVVNDWRRSYHQSARKDILKYERKAAEEHRAANERFILNDKAGAQHHVYMYKSYVKMVKFIKFMDWIMP